VDDATHPPDPRFPTTRWGRVVTAGGDPAGAGEALSELCRAYWYPLYAFIRRRGSGPHEAADLTQAYFAGLLERGALARADPLKGRFRSFLRADCAFFLADQADRARALKRGGGVAPLSIDARDAEGRYRVEPADEATPERSFDRDWAHALLARALEAVADEHRDPPRAALFEALKVVLTDGPRAAPHARIASELGLSVAAVESAARRLRRQFAQAVRSEIASTLDDPSPTDVEDEIRALFDALGR
jgi:DNA-directed RNA polymerase specialized sigma24 family protein